MDIWQSFWGLLLNILVALNSFVNNPGIAIILFTLLIRLLTVPLTMKSLRSSRAMQQIQPEIKRLQKEYANDKQKQQEATMKLYQQYGINPAAGCFPMLIQLPVFFGLYSALSFVVSLHAGTDADVAQHMTQLHHLLFNPAWEPYATNFNSAFLWMPNLALADPLHIIPILSGVFQFIQSRMSMPRRDPSQPMDSQTRMMQGIMQFMPIYIIFISWGFPAGTVIYWAFSSLFGAVQQYFITGFGTLPDIPGLGWLPRKELPKPAPLGALPEAASPTTALATPKKSGGMMGWMMDKALAAQEAQKAAQAQAGQGTSSTSTPTNGSTVKRKGSEPQVKAVPTDTMYASDIHYRENGSENGYSNGKKPATNGRVTRDSFTSSTQLPRKRRNKR